MTKRISIANLSLMFKIIVLAVFSLLLANAVYGQTTTSPFDGTTPSTLAPGAPIGSYALSGFERINLSNLHFSFSLPLMQVGGRGSASYTIPLGLENTWSIDHQIVPNPPFCSPLQGCTPVPPTHYYYPTHRQWGRLFPGMTPGVLQGRRGGWHFREIPSCGYPTKWVRSLSRITFTSIDGTEQEFHDERYNGEPKETDPQCGATYTTNRGNVFVTRDGTSATVILDSDVIDQEYVQQSESDIYFYPSGYMMLRDGTRYRFDEGKISWVRDRNGNRLNFTYNQYGSASPVTDLLNRQINSFTETSPDGATILSAGFTIKGFQGATRKIELGYATMQDIMRQDQTVRPYTELFPTLNSPSGLYNPPNMLAYVKLPDGRRYNFFYDSYGELARVVLPTGAAIEYDYTPIFLERTVNPGSLEKVILMLIRERRFYPDGGTGSKFATKTTYERDLYLVDGPCTVKTYTSDASGNLTLKSHEKHYFWLSGNSRGIPYILWSLKPE